MSNKKVKKETVEEKELTLDDRIANLEGQIEHTKAMLNQLHGALALAKELKSLEKSE